jgi:hypothetical protein
MFQDLKSLNFWNLSIQLDSIHLDYLNENGVHLNEGVLVLQFGLLQHSSWK